MEIKATFLCENVIIDSRNNQMSLINLHEDELKPLGYPYVFNSIDFVALIEKEASEPNSYQGTLAISLNGNSIINSPVNIDFMNSNRHRAIFDLKGFMIKEPGDLSFKIEISGIQLVIEKRIELLPIINFR
jgi:hypothetical protein